MALQEPKNGHRVQAANNCTKTNQWLKTLHFWLKFFVVVCHSLGMIIYKTSKLRFVRLEESTYILVVVAALNKNNFTLGTLLARIFLFFKKTLFLKMTNHRIQVAFFLRFSYQFREPRVIVRFSFHWLFINTLSHQVLLVRTLNNRHIVVASRDWNFISFLLLSSLTTTFVKLSDPFSVTCF